MHAYKRARILRCATYYCRFLTAFSRRQTRVLVGHRFLFRRSLLSTGKLLSLRLSPRSCLTNAACLSKSYSNAARYCRWQMLFSPAGPLIAVTFFAVFRGFRNRVLHASFFIITQSVHFCVIIWSFNQSAMILSFSNRRNFFFFFVVINPAVVFGRNVSHCFQMRWFLFYKIITSLTLFYEYKTWKKTLASCILFEFTRRVLLKHNNL